MAGLGGGRASGWAGEEFHAYKWPHFSTQMCCLSGAGEMPEGR